MKIGIIQSNYIPWRGYFYFIQSVDHFVFHDDLQYTKQDWRNRNLIKTKQGVKWLSVPVKYLQTAQLINETEVYYDSKNKSSWQRDHLNQFKQHYDKAPFVNDAITILQEAFQFHDRTISELNIRLIRQVCAYLGISTTFSMSSDYGLSGKKTDRLIQLLRKLGATHYLSGPAAESYLDKRAFVENGIALEYVGYDFPSYPQLWGEFIGNVSVLDLIANCGPEAYNYLNHD